MNMVKAHTGLRVTGLAVVLLLIFSIAHAVSPSPELLDKIAKGEKTQPYFMKNLDVMHSKGICTGANLHERAFMAAKGAVDYSPAYTGPFNVLALLVQFTDNPSAAPAVYFDSLLFDTVGVTVRDYYDEISYGQLDLVTVELPSSLGWLTAPQPYTYYVNGQNGTGSYPNNTQKLVEDLVTMVDGTVDFSVYDNDNNGWVDVLVVIHAGQGAESTGDSTDIWSHKWSISPRMTDDGVYVSSFTVQPEYLSSPGDMTIGVFAHELGHAFGLPDLYDTDYSSGGIGKWGIMSFGSWLGAFMNGSLPAQPCAWSRIQLGFANPIVVSSNIDSQAIPDVKTSGEIYRMWTSGNVGDEYFLVENRQKTGYDTYLPASGILIWHVDEAKGDNDDEWYPGKDPSVHPVVALEQADGLFELEHYNDLGDAGDVFQGAGTNTFNGVSATTSDSYTSGPSYVAVENVGLPGLTMFADLKVAFSSGTDPGNQPLPTTVYLSQNYPNPFNPSTSIDIDVSVGGRAKLSVFNILGEYVATVLNGYITAGVTPVVWDGTNDHGDDVASGFYFYRLQFEDQEQVRKMILLR